MSKKQSNKSKKGNPKSLAKSIRKKITRASKGKTSGSDKPIAISNDTIAAQREEILSSARKFIFPLQHSRHRIVWLSIGVFILSIIGLSVYTYTALYRQYSTSAFTYRITRVIPLPIAKIDGKLVPYEDYLFNLRRLMHYHRVKGKIDFNTDEGRSVMDDIKRSSMEQAITNTFVEDIAKKRHINISDKELDRIIEEGIRQGRLGSSEQLLKDTIKDNFDWSISDFKRALKQQILAKRVASSLDEDAHRQANAAKKALKSGKTFKEVMTEYSDDKNVGEGDEEYSFEIARDSRDVTMEVVDAAFAMKEGDISDVIDTGYSLEIIKVISKDNDRLRVSHIQIKVKDISEHAKRFEKDNKTVKYVNIESFVGNPDK